ncbi:ABC transporter substrate-binding protein [Natronorubrum halophilum]|uniref:ABC transporter substrate-binding protein n=1 Tax=Natronorubrum halophilum TaxID=1702106 RepID=UPI000EF70E61|nr:ABC transporter substrate-binding protein [Natronorubrum halophilum]
MSDDTTDTTHEAPTRRDTLKYGGTLVTGSLLAGCSELVGQDDGAEGTDSQGSYEACIEPVGCLSLEEVPETWMALTGPWADMAVALGQRDGFRPAGWYPQPYFYDRVGVSMPTDVPNPLAGGGWDKELFYELDPDIILCDPNYLHKTGFDDSWDESDTEEIVETVAPFFGNNIVRRREFHEYELYSLYEAFDRLADVFDERERYEAFVDVHDELWSEIDSKLSADQDRPEIGLINFGSDLESGEFAAMTTDSEGVEMKQYRDLGIKSAFSDEQTDGMLDYEAMLDVDPEIIVVHGGVRLTDETGEFSASAFHDQFVAPLSDHPVGRQLTAVQNDAVYPGPYFQQGPIVSLFQTELVARLLYPETFGAFDPERFPDVPEDQQLFDRGRVAAIIDGEI